jgi:hypothetical protein
VASARAFDNKALHRLDSGNFAEALLPAKQAVEIFPESTRARDLYCRSLVSSDKPHEALVECAEARRLALLEPWNQKGAQEATQRMKYIAERFHLPLPPGVE